MYPVTYDLLIVFSCLYVLCCVLSQSTSTSAPGGDMAIHHATYRGSLEMVKYLIQEAGVDVNVRGMVRVEFVKLIAIVEARHISYYGVIFSLF